MMQRALTPMGGGQLSKGGRLTMAEDKRVKTRSQFGSADATRRREAGIGSNRRPKRNGGEHEPAAAKPVGRLRPRRRR